MRCSRKQTPFLPTPGEYSQSFPEAEYGQTIFTLFKTKKKKKKSKYKTKPKAFLLQETGLFFPRFSPDSVFRLKLLHLPWGGGMRAHTPGYSERPLPASQEEQATVL